jgi:hypothetical protein
MTPEERWSKIENALATAAELHAHNESMMQTLLQDRAEINALQKDMLRSQIDLYRSQDRLIQTMDTLAQATITLSQTMGTISSKLDRVLDLAEQFLRGGSGNGRSSS